MSLLRIMTFVIVLGLAGFAVAACDVFDPKFKTVSLDSETNANSGSSIVTDAEQRMVLNVNPGNLSKTGLVDPLRIVCAEPSPDVAKALSTALSVSAGLAGQGQGSVGFGTAEGLVQLAERTVTVQVVREMMYRACEAYADGAITGTTQSMQWSRMGDLLATLVAVEVAGGEFGRTLGGISGEASAEGKAALGSVPERKADLDAASNELTDARKEEAKAETEYQDAQGDADDAPDDAALQTKADDKKKAHEAAVRRREAAEDRFKETSEALSKVVTKATASAGGEIKLRQASTAADAIARIHQQYVQGDAAQAYIAACVVELGLLDRHSALAQQCESNVRDVVAKSQSMHLKRYELDTSVRLEAERAKLVEALSGLLARCDALTDPTTKTNCQKLATQTR